MLLGTNIPSPVVTIPATVKFVLIETVGALMLISPTMPVIELFELVCFISKAFPVEFVKRIDPVSLAALLNCWRFPLFAWSVPVALTPQLCVSNFVAPWYCKVARPEPPDPIVPIPDTSKSPYISYF